ncbi:MoxR-like ATPase [Enterococcus sp. PF1-24]|uniref:AAA family ATPase n=1 Tax=unclassified Enterococcus TaxID=2608891 RepID=UPI00247374CA|nr:MULTISPECIES: MoxR family ATPase [unclassified Enterococcus]MDH6365500.1 MoxR-like ATPase [Enterococcus sp. PFB1-1]MDH6402601.1 MoxR-like ATPase [Enterococcus sp. PF1-24]
MNNTDSKKIQAIIAEIEKVIFGKHEVIQLTVAALLTGGHVLFEDVPGVGKTKTIKALAKTLGSDFSRVQFTPDLLPSDILGVSIFNPQTQQFEFREGPVFTTVLLVDEINRATPRTQSALLEAMSENQVTIDNQTYPLAEDFFVLATQNPLEYEGTYPLPEAQLDRFLFRLKFGYPSFKEEFNLLMTSNTNQMQNIKQVLHPAELQQLKQTVNEVYIDKLIVRYALQLVHASRKHPEVALGISPRGAIAFIQGAKAYALTEGRQYVVPQDLQKILPAVFGHRLLLKNSRNDSNAVEEVLQQILRQVSVPVRREK